MRVVFGHQPTSRAECASCPRPCPWESCRYHLGPGAETCALDVADRGGASINEVAALLGVSKQRIDQITKRAVVKIAVRMGLHP